MSRKRRFLLVSISSVVFLSVGSAHGEAPDPARVPGGLATSTLPTMPLGGQVTAFSEYNPCNTSTGDPYDVCKNYVNYRPGDNSVYPMRWGHSGFGFRHIRDRHGFGPVTDDRIQDTIDNGNYDPQTRTSYRITHPSHGCNYRVILETLAAKGIITAFCE